MTGLSPLIWAGALGALVGGATGSLHCALMCGPLASAVLPSPPASRRAVALAWHGGRLLAYGAVGAALGGLGEGVARVLALRVEPVLPWVMAVGLVLSALEIGRRLKPLPGVANVSRAIARLGAGLRPAGRAMALGACTPFLPCGLLYGMFVAAMATGSASAGSALLVLFGLGAAPALAGVQAGTGVGARFPRAARVLRTAVPLAAAAVLVWRALMLPNAAAAPLCH